MVKVVQISEFVGLEMLTYADADIGAPGYGYILLRQTAIGVNYNQVYPLSDTSRANREMETGKNIGSTALFPEGYATLAPVMGDD